MLEIPGVNDNTLGVIGTLRRWLEIPRGNDNPPGRVRCAGSLAPGASSELCSQSTTCSVFQACGSAGVGSVHAVLCKRRPANDDPFRAFGI